MHSYGLEKTHKIYLMIKETIYQKKLMQTKIICLLSKIPLMLSIV